MIIMDFCIFFFVFLSFYFYIANEEIEIRNGLVMTIKIQL
jgi:hypothetical protein